MERLTTPWCDGTFDTFDPIDIVDNEYSKINYEKVLNKLGAYEDAEEQGLLLRLPCKVGDTVYKLWYANNKPYKVQKLTIRTLSNLVAIMEGLEFGKTVFLTKEEAEQKLESMRGGE